ncbi:MAG: hypothetical protein GYB65_03765 [Chloroflexi bacterium]|nr:hypothetical protein [Chloroflexota bacterium]
MRRHQTAPRSRLAVDAALTPADQEQHAIQVAIGFKQHYLAAITYLDDHRIAVATIKPTGTQKRPVEAPQEIWVDASGNVTIVPCDHPTRRRRINPAWVLLVLLVLTSMALLF